MQTRKKHLLLAITLLALVTLACRAVIPERVLDETGSHPTSDRIEETESQPALEDGEHTSSEGNIEEAPDPVQKNPQDEGEEVFETPTLSGEAQTIDTEHFRVHYTLSGDDAIPNIEYAETVAKSMEHIWKVEVDQMGWSPPPPDDGSGGDDRYDVYLLNIFEEDGTAGYTDGGFPETFVGDNPRTPAVETRAHYSYLALDNDYSDLGEYEDIDYSVLDYMRSTAAHEFNHAIQFAYDGEEPAEWLWEATATWIQSQVYPELTDADEELVAVFKSPDTCQLAYGGEERVEDENRWYGLWILVQYISENHGPDTVRSIWENARELDGYEALEVALFDAGTTLDQTFRDFSLALLTRDFERGDEFPTVRLEGEAAMGSTFEPQDGVGQMAADYVEIQAEGVVAISLEAESLSGVLVGLQNGTASTFAMPDNQIALDVDPFGHLYLIVLNENRAETEYDCQFTPYTLTVQPASQTAGEPTSRSTAPNFSPPEVEGLLDPAEYWGDDWQPPVDPPENLIPAYVPEGYELADSYEMTREAFEAEYEDDVDWYIPGDGPAIVIEFKGPGEHDYFDITASDSPYDNLDDWLYSMDYEPYEDELTTIAGSTVLLEDWSEPNDPYTAATFILDDQFIVLTGTLAPDEMTPIVESLLPE